MRVHARACVRVGARGWVSGWVGGHGACNPFAEPPLPKGRGGGGPGGLAGIGWDQRLSKGSIHTLHESANGITLQMTGQSLNYRGEPEQGGEARARPGGP
jgi:hypothetical protein